MRSDACSSPIMASNPNLPSPDSLARDALMSLLTQVEGRRDEDVLTIYGPLFYSVENRVRWAVERLDKRRSKLLVILDTPGGLIETAERIVTTIRHHYGEVSFLVPDRAMSAGTILAMSGDHILMDYYSCLGPIDPQVERLAVEGQESRFVPALGYLDQYQMLVDKAKKGKLTDADVILLNKLDLAELRRYELEVKRSIKLIEQWLAKYKFKDWVRTATRRKKVTDKMRRQRAVEIGKALNDHERWGAHSRGINMQTLTQDLNLRIQDYSGDSELKRLVQDYHWLLRNLGVSSFVHSRAFL